MTARVPGPAMVLSLLLVVSALLSLAGLVPERLPDLAAAGVAGAMASRLAQACGWTGWHPALAGTLLAAGLDVGEILMPALRYMPFLLVTLVHLGLAWFFAEGLRPGRQPVLLRLVEIMGLKSLDDARFVRFMRGQCVVWSAAALATAAVSFGCMLGAPWGTPIWALVWAQVIWFGLSHEYARWRYERPETWWLTLRTMVRPDVWPELAPR